jgi:hypothetical protein
MSRSAQRAALVGGAVIWSVMYSLYVTRVGPPLVRPDYVQLWLAARALAAGHDPYGVVGPDRPYQFHYPLYYPMPAVTRRNDFTRAPALLSMSMLIALQWGQFAPLLAAAMVYPWLGGLMAVKPTAGLAVLCAQRPWRHVVLAGSVAVVLVVISFVVDPAWVTSWRAAVRVSVEVPPVMRPFGGAPPARGVAMAAAGGTMAAGVCGGSDHFTHV